MVIWEQRATCATYSINWLVFITQMKSVYSAVRNGSLNKAVCASPLNGYLRTNSDLCHLQHKLIGFYNPDEKCLQRGTDWVFKYSSLRFGFRGLNYTAGYAEGNGNSNAPDKNRIPVINSADCSFANWTTVDYASKTVLWFARLWLCKILWFATPCSFVEKVLTFRLSSCLW